MHPTTRPAWRALLFAVFLCPVAALLSSCGGHEGGGHGAGHGEAVPAPVAEGLKVPQAYDDAAWQARFAQLYTQYYEMFMPISEGFRVRAQFLEGGDIVGAFMGMTNSDVYLMTATGNLQVAADRMTTNSRVRLFAADFAMVNAMRDVEIARAKGIAPDAAAVAAVEEPVIEHRFAVTEGPGLDIRLGPGKNFKPRENVQVVKGQLIHVVEERDGWIRFNAPAGEGTNVSVWVNKFTTLPREDVNAEEQESDIRTLQDEGVIVEFIASNNVARVNAELWNEMDFLVRQGIGRSLAFYCGTARGTGLNWVEFRDARSGRRIAKYSEALGLKIYSM
jgi:SH3-like domain-containing protein